MPGDIDIGIDEQGEVTLLPATAEAIQVSSSDAVSVYQPTPRGKAKPSKVAGELAGPDPQPKIPKHAWDPNPDSKMKDRLRREFFNSLPDNQLSEAELELRDALVNWARERGNEKFYPNLSQAGRDRRVDRARRALLPKHIPTSLWVDGRIASELDLHRVDWADGIFATVPGELNEAKLQRTFQKYAIDRTGCPSKRKHEEC
jgi:hypothetical protein